MTINDPSLSVIGYHLLPLATTQLVGIMGNLMLQAYFHPFYLSLVEGSL